MSKKKQQDSTTGGFEGVESVLSKTEKYIEENQKSLTIIVIGIIAIVGIYLGFNKFYVDPLEEEAQSQMFVAEQYFERDSFNLALYGDGNYLGFLDIIDEYGITKSANLGYYYAGISFLRLGEYENAIDYLKQFDSNDQLISGIALGAIGDSYVELENIKDAISFYINASNKKNKLTTPLYLMKAGQLYEIQEDYKNALKVYENIQKNYPQSTEGRNIEKHIARVNAKLSN